MGEFRSAAIRRYYRYLDNYLVSRGFCVNRKKRFLWAICLTMVFANPAQAGKAMDRLNAFLAQKGAIQARFVQTINDNAFSQPKESRGNLLMQRPGKFRWDYETPYKQLILADGQRLWIYDPDLAQVVVKPLESALGDTPALLLSGRGSSGADSLEQQFNIIESLETRDGLYWVTLKPRAKESSFQEVRLGFGEKHLQRMELVDGFGQQTMLEFLGMQTNVEVPGDSFRFDPPKGVDIVGNPDVNPGNRQ